MKHILKRKKLLAFFVLFTLLLSILGVSYAYWMLTKYQDDKNVVTSKCFKVTMFKEGTGITLEKAHPISEEEGQSLEGYTFSIENTCSTIATYQINLEEIELPTETKRLSGEYIKVSLNGSKGKKLDLFDEVDPTFKKDEEGEGVTTDESHKLTTGKLDPGEKKDFTLKLWMSDDTPAKDETMNALFKSKVSIINSYKENGNNKITVDVETKNQTYSNESETIQIISTSELYDLKEYSFDDKEYIPIDQGSQKYTLEKIHDTEGTYKIYFKDIEGNTVTKEYETTMLDQKGPEIEVTKEDGKLKIQFQDEKSGLKEYKIDSENKEGSWIKLDDSNTNEVEYTIEESSIIFISVKDNVDNENFTDYYVLENDENMPTISATNDLTEWNIKDAINLTLTDNESGIKEITILKDEKEIYHEKLPKAMKTYQHKQEVTENGTYQIKVKDLYGNETISNIKIEKIDTIPPIVHGNITTERDTVTIDLSESVDNEMKIQQYEYCLNENCITSNESNHTFENVRGIYKITGRVYDENNNHDEITQNILVDPAAQIEDTKYETLQNAIDAATENKTITILRDIEEHVDINESKEIILNVDKYKINSDTEETPTILNKGTLTINGGTIDSKNYVPIQSYGTTNISNSIITGSLNSIMIMENSHVTIDGENTQIGGNDIMEENGLTYSTIYTYPTSELKIKNGTITSLNSAAIQNSENSNVEISGGTINSKTSITIYSNGNINISGGIITSTSNTIIVGEKSHVTISGESTKIVGNAEIFNEMSYPTIYVYNDGRLTVENGEIVSANSTTIKNIENSIVEISGGTINSENDIAIVSNGTVNISGGTIAGTSNAIDVKKNSNVTISGNSTIKVNGTQTYETIYVYEGGDLTINDGNISGINKPTIRNSKNSTLTITGGNITSETSSAINNYGTLKISGGIIKGKANTISARADSSTTISGEDTKIGGNDELSSSGSGYPTIFVYGDATLNVQNGNITSINSSAIYSHEATANTNIYGGTINSENNVAIDNIGVTTISGGTINSETSNAINVRKNSTVNISGDTTNIIGANKAINSTGITKISGGTITGTNNAIDIRKDSNVTISGNSTIKVNGTQKSETIYVYEGGDLTINDGNISGNNKNTMYIDENATVTISGGNITSETSSAINNYGTLKVSGGTIKGNANSITARPGSNVTITENPIIGGNDRVSDSGGGYPTIWAYENSEVNISGGNITSINSNPIYSTANSTVNISGGTITSQSSAAIDTKGTVTISGGTITGTQNSIVVRKDANVKILGEKTQIGGSDQVSSSGSVYPTIYVYEEALLNVENGTIKSINSSAIYGKANSTANISGGNITSETSSAINNYGTLTVSGGIIKGRTNTIIVRSNSNITISGNPIIGGNDTLPSTSSGTYPTINVYKNSTVNIQSGTITSINSTPIQSQADTNITISGGTFSSEKNSIIISSAGTTNITGGTFKGTVYITGNTTIDGTTHITSNKDNSPAVYVYTNGYLEIKNGTIEANDYTAVVDLGTTIISGPATITNNSSSRSTIHIGANAVYTNNANSGSTIKNNGGGNIEYHASS